MSRWVVLVALALVGVTFVAAGAKDDKEVAAPATAPTTGPAKEVAMQTLRDLLAAIEGKDYDRAMGLMVLGNMKREDAPAALQKLLELREVSAKGIDIIAAQGKWGTLTEVVGAERAKLMLRRAGGAPVESCYMITLRNAEAGFVWDGKAFKVFRLNNVGQLE